MKLINKNTIPEEALAGIRKLPLPEEFKNILVGTSVFGPKDLDIINSNKGYFAVYSENKGGLLEKLNDKLKIYILPQDKCYVLDVK